MRIYTKTGDDGTTGQYGTGERMSKASLLCEAIGNVDELNATIGLALASTPTLFGHEYLLNGIQKSLFVLGADIATPLFGAPAVDRIRKDDTKLLEEVIDGCERENRPLDSFILPGGSQTGTAFHLARTICRRAERSLWRLIEESPEGTVNQNCALYLNRLSDFLFVFSRWINSKLNHPETPWRP